MITQINHFHKLGFALHWLRPKSKIPLENAWNKGPRKTVKELQASYVPGFNLGVRLGQSTQLTDGMFLAVIDCDVKSKDKKHLAEMKAKLHGLLGDFENYPFVASGRGNGSCHIYIKTKIPVKPFRYSQSNEKVSVKMPSVKTTPYEEKTLTKKEIEDGYRLRAAWEISVMGEGQQVVIPPSIHPDTAAKYTWGAPIDSCMDIPLVEFEQNQKSANPKEKDVSGFIPIEIDLVSSSLDNKMVDLILSGEGCTDRSASLFTVAIAMYKEGFSDNEILSVLTDPENFLGQTAYDHTNSKSRIKAAGWVWKHTLMKVKKEIAPANDFQNVLPDVILSMQNAQKQLDEIKGDYLSQIERGPRENGGRPKPTFRNVVLILMGAVSENLFIRDDFAESDQYGVDTPWGGKRGRELRDQDAIFIKAWLAEHYRVEPSTDKIHEAITYIASRNRVHPVRDFLTRLTWDGVPRLDNWLVNYLNAKGDRRYLQSVGRKVICAMVARVLEPGCKFDQVLILEGEQGIGKSTAVRLLADPWYSDAHTNIDDKDAVVSLRSVWVRELGELSGMRKADANRLKEFISQQIDRIRMPYGRRAEDFPRQCIFIGTTNSDSYLKDTTGNRRFWPVEVGQCTLKKLKRDRDQLLAEAYIAWELGEKLYLDDPKIIDIATSIQNDKKFDDPWINKLQEFFDSKPKNFDVNGFTINEIFSDFGAIPLPQIDIQKAMRAGECLRLLGFKKKRVMVDGVKKVLWGRDYYTIGWGLKRQSAAGVAEKS